MVLGGQIMIGGKNHSCRRLIPVVDWEVVRGGVSHISINRMRMGMSGTHGSTLLLERESAALTITEFSARLVALVILSVAVMDNFFAVTFLYKLVHR